MEGAKVGRMRGSKSEGRNPRSKFEGRNPRVKLRGSNFEGGGGCEDDGVNEGGGGCEGGEDVKVGSL